MTQDQINILIPKIHAERKERGEWDGFPEQASPADGAEEFERVRMKRNAYLAQKLDLITEAIVDAMRARREGRRCVLADNARGDPIAFVTFRYHILGTSEDHLALAAIRTMDLMGFHRVEYSRTNPNPRFCVEKLIRGAICNLSRCGVMGTNIERTLNDTLKTILHMAQLDSIDLQWHINARREHERSQQCNQ